MSVCQNALDDPPLTLLNALEWVGQSGNIKLLLGLDIPKRSVDSCPQDIDRRDASGGPRYRIGDIVCVEHERAPTEQPTGVIKVIDTLADDRSRVVLGSQITGVDERRELGVVRAKFEG